MRPSRTRRATTIELFLRRVKYSAPPPQQKEKNQTSLQMRILFIEKNTVRLTAYARHFAEKPLKTAKNFQEKTIKLYTYIRAFRIALIILLRVAPHNTLRIYANLLKYICATFVFYYYKTLRATVIFMCRTARGQFQWNFFHPYR